MKKNVYAVNFTLVFYCMLLLGFSYARKYFKILFKKSANQVQSFLTENVYSVIEFLSEIKLYLYLKIKIHIIRAWRILHLYVFVCDLLLSKVEINLMTLQIKYQKFIVYIK